VNLCNLAVASPYKRSNTRLAPDWKVVSPASSMASRISLPSPLFSRIFWSAVSFFRSSSMRPLAFSRSSLSFSAISSASRLERSVIAADSEAWAAISSLSLSSSPATWACICTRTSSSTCLRTRAGASWSGSHREGSPQPRDSHGNSPA